MKLKPPPFRHTCATHVGLYFHQFWWWRPSCRQLFRHWNDRLQWWWWQLASFWWCWRSSPLAMWCVRTVQPSQISTALPWFWPTRGGIFWFERRWRFGLRHRGWSGDGLAAPSYLQTSSVDAQSTLYPFLCVHVALEPQEHGGGEVPSSKARSWIAAELCHWDRIGATSAWVVVYFWASWHCWQLGNCCTAPFDGAAVGSGESLRSVPLWACGPRVTRTHSKTDPLVAQHTVCAHPLWQQVLSMHCATQTDQRIGGGNFSQ